MDEVIVKFQADVSDLRADLNRVRSDVNDIGQSGEGIGAGVSRGTAQAQRSIGGLRGTLNGIGGAIRSVAGPLVAAFAIQDVVRTAVNSVREFELSLDQLASITGLDQTGEAFQSLRQGAIDLARDSSLTADQVAQAFATIGSARPELLQNAEALQQVTQASITLSEAGVIGLDQASTALTGTLAQFGLGAADAERVINSLAAGSQAGAAGISEVADTIRVAGTSLAANNVTVEEAVALTETLAERQIVGAEAGTALRNVTLRLANSGRGFVDGQFDIATALRETSAEFEAIQDPVERGQALTQLFGLESQSAAQVLLSSVDAFENYNEAVTGTNTANEQAAINTDNLSTRIDVLRGRYNDFFLTLGEGSSPIEGIVRLLVDGLIFAFDILEQQVGIFGDAFSELFDAFGEIGTVITDLIDELGFFEGGLENNIDVMDIFRAVAESIVVPVRLFAALIRLVADGTRTAADAFRNAYQEGGIFTQIIDGIVTSVRALFGRLGDLVSGISEWLGLDFTPIRDTTEAVMEQAQEIDNNAENAIGLAEALDGVGDANADAEANVESLTDSLRGQRTALLELLNDQALNNEIDLDLVARVNDITFQLDEAEARLERALAGVEVGDLAVPALLEPRGLNTEGLGTIEVATELAVAPSGNAAQQTQEALDQQTLDRRKAQQQELNAFILDESLSLADDLFERGQERTQEEIELNREREEEELERLEEQLASQEISQAQFEEAKQRLARETAENERQLQLRAARQNRARALFDIALNTAVAVAAGLATPAIPPFPSAIAAGVFGAAQAALVLAQPLPSFSKGGLLKGASHANGGILLGNNGRAFAEAEGNEFIVNKKMTMKHLPLLEDINSGKFQYSDYILPALAEMNKTRRQESNNDLARAITSNSNNHVFNDLNLIDSDKKTRKILLDISKNVKSMNSKQPFER